MAYFVRTDITPLKSVTLSQENIPSKLDEVYKLVKEQTDKDGFTIAAWKLGGTTPAAQKDLKIDTLFFAPMHLKETLGQPSITPGFEVLHLKTESEVALRISASAEAILSKGAEAIKNAPMEQLFDAWCYAFEMPSPSTTNAGDFGVPAIVLDRCAAGSLALGHPHPYGASTQWGDTELTVKQDGEVVATGNTNALVASADVCAKDFLIEALKHGFEPEAGQWIATGGMTPCISLKKGTNVTLTAGSKVVLDVQVGW